MSAVTDFISTSPIFYPAHFQTLFAVAKTGTAKVIFLLQLVDDDGHRCI
jgi:hypothetical protein